MNNNKNLHKAKKAKNDEFYTRYEDIEKEICHYDLRGKKIYCNCDDYRWSNFVKYFHDNFEALGIREICATGYDLGQGAYLYRFDGENVTVSKLEGNGDFRSEECVNILKQCDVVVTNPPFSLFREYVAQLMKYNKKFLIIGNMNAIAYKENFPLIKDNKIWTGYKSFGGGMDFYVGPNYDKNKCKHPKYDDKGKLLINVMGCIWFTNIEHSKRTYPLDLYKKYNAEKHPKYDNYDAIHCERVEDIPCDYSGVIGVPITFVGKYCPTQFEILGIANNVSYMGDFPCLVKINGKSKYTRILIRRK